MDPIPYGGVVFPVSRDSEDPSTAPKGVTALGPIGAMEKGGVVSSGSYLQTQATFSSESSSKERGPYLEF
jgi:hypothetical protein